MLFDLPEGMYVTYGFNTRPMIFCGSCWLVMPSVMIEPHAELSM